MPVFLFTDIAGSTGLWEQHSQAMGPALARHDEILQELIAKHGGRILRHRGDGLSVVFENGQPLACVLVAQKQLVAEDWGEIGELRVCMALHAGEAERREFTSETIGQKEEYFGPVLNRTARILTAGSGGQILLTPEVVERCELPAQASLQDLGQHLLKSLDTPQQVYGLLHPDLPLQSFPPLRTLARVSTPPPPCPYRGLFAFREEDAPYFFGRETFTDRLAENIHRQKMVAVIGPSGSGKSSVMFAGLTPRLRQAGNWMIVNFRPGSRPFSALAAALTPPVDPQLTTAELLAEADELAETLWQNPVSLLETVQQIMPNNLSSAPKRLLLLADQFEELYTLCPEPEVRFRFLEMLLSLATPTVAVEEAMPEVHLGLTLRADFMGQALIHRPFANALQDATLLLGPMTRSELEQAIEKPATKHGVTFETGLVTRILDEVGNEPGNLPLLEFALTLLWERQVEGQLTHTAYEAIGQVEGALAHHADMVYQDLSPVEQERARWIFVQMVQPGEGTEDTRRLATRTELGAGDWEMVRQLADARLVVTDRDPSGQETVEVVHEALIRGWARLRAWMNADRAFRIWQERLRAAMRQWEASKQDEGALLRGALLAEAEEWVEVRPGVLGPEERRFFQASLKLRDQEQVAAEAQRRRELAQAQALADAERQRAEAEHQRAEEQARAGKRFRLLAAGLAIVFFLAVGAAIWASFEQSEAKTNADLAATRAFEANAARTAAEVAQGIAEKQAQIALSRQLAAQTATYLNDKPDLALLLGLESNRLADSAEAEGELLVRSKFSPYLDSFIHSHPQLIEVAIALSPDGQTLASSDNKTITIWDVVTRQSRRELGAFFENLGDMTFSPDGKMLAAVGDGESIGLWNTAAGQPLGEPLTVPGEAFLSIAFSPDGQTLAAGTFFGTIMLWDMATGQLLGEPLTGHTDGVESVAYSPDGQTLASAGRDHTVRLWDVREPQSNDVASRQLLGSPLTGHNNNVVDVAFSPDGKILASASQDATIILWDASTGQSLGPPLTGHIVGIKDIAFSPDGQILASAGADKTIVLWNVATQQPIGLPLTGHVAEVTNVLFSPDGRFLISNGQDGKIIVWNLEAARYLLGHADSIRGVAVSPDGQTIASGSKDGVIILWDAASGQPLGLPLTDHAGDVRSVAFSPDGQILGAGGGDDGLITLWDVPTRQLIGQLSSPGGHGIATLTFSPDGRTLASGGWDFAITLWDVGSFHSNDAATIQPFQQLTGHTNAIRSVAFSPDGRTLASGSDDNTVILWDLTTGQPLGEPLAGHTNPVNSVIFSPDGRILASGSGDNTVILWDVTTGRPVGEPLAAHTRSVNVVDFSPDGQILASASSDNTIILWDVATGQPLGPPLTGHTGSVKGLDFSPDGQILASGSSDSTVIVWQVDLEPWPVRACRMANRNLTEAEWEEFLGDKPYHPTCPDLPIDSLPE